MFVGRLSGGVDGPPMSKPLFSSGIVVGFVRVEEIVVCVSRAGLVGAACHVGAVRCLSAHCGCIVSVDSSPVSIDGSMFHGRAVVFIAPCAVCGLPLHWGTRTPDSDGSIWHWLRVGQAALDRRNPDW